MDFTLLNLQRLHRMGAEELAIKVTKEQVKDCSLAELIWFRSFFWGACNWEAATVVSAELKRRGFRA